MNIGHLDRERRVDKELGRWLSTLRQRKGMTIEAATNALHISEERLMDLENGVARPSIKEKECIRFCLVYGISAHEIKRMAIEGD